MPAVLIAAVMVLTAVAVLTPAEETEAGTVNVVYLQLDRTTSAPQTAEELTSAADFGGAAGNRTLTHPVFGDGWFVVTADIDLSLEDANNKLTIVGTANRKVNLIIGADCTLTIPLGIIVNNAMHFNLYTQDPASVSGSDFGKLVVTNGPGVTFNTDNIYRPFSNTAIIEASGDGVFGNGNDYLEVKNGSSGEIHSGDDGVYGYTVRVENDGYIYGQSNGIKAIYGLSVLNNGRIVGATESGIIIEDVNAVNGAVHNHNQIIGNNYGIYVDITATSYMSNFETGTITGTNIAGVFSEGTIVLENDGLIEGTDGTGLMCNSITFVYNNKSGSAVGAEIYGGDYGILCSQLHLENQASVYGGDYNGVEFSSGEVYNGAGMPGVIMGGQKGIQASEAMIVNYQNSSILAGLGGEWAIDIDNSSGPGCATIMNYGIIKGPEGIRIALQPAGWLIYNDRTGEIESTSSAKAIEVLGGDQASLENWNIIKGDVIFLTGVTVVTLAANSGTPSEITGDLTCGANPASELYFRGEPDPNDLVYSKVGGIANIGNPSVLGVDDSELPPTYAGEILTLIDASGGIVGSPSNSSFTIVSPRAMTLDLSIIPSLPMGDMLIAGLGAGSAHAYYIKAFHDAGSTISPGGMQIFSMYDEQKYVFAAKPGFIITEVKIDYLHNLTPAQIALGEYTFKDIMANHSISVKSAAGSPTDLTLRIDIKSGSGYAEYSIDGGGTYVKYSSVVVITQGTNVLIRAVADDGSVFDKWETPSVETTPTLALSDFRASKVINLYFTGDGSGSSGTNVLLIVGLILLVLIVLLVLYFVFKKRSKAAA